MNPAPFRVIWRRTVVETRIAGFMLELIDRGESNEPLFRAMNRIDELLSVDPDGQGESRDNFERVLFEPPLSITFEVQADERVVIVLRARYVRPRGGHDWGPPCPPASASSRASSTNWPSATDRGGSSCHPTPTRR